MAPAPPVVNPFAVPAAPQPAAPQPALNPPPAPELVAQLVQMGFGEVNSREALRATGNLQTAANFLLLVSETRPEVRQI